MKITSILLFTGLTLGVLTLYACSRKSTPTISLSPEDVTRLAQARFGDNFEVSYNQSGTVILIYQQYSPKNSASFHNINMVAYEQSSSKQLAAWQWSNAVWKWYNDTVILVDFNNGDTIDPNQQTTNRNKRAYFNVTDGRKILNPKQLKPIQTQRR